jgi:hypothetical protein
MSDANGAVSHVGLWKGLGRDALTHSVVEQNRAIGRRWLDVDDSRLISLGDAVHGENRKQWFPCDQR